MEKQLSTHAKQSLSPSDLSTEAIAPCFAIALREGKKVDLRALALLLIKEDLRSSKLVLGLSASGLDSGLP
jgi:hypothetical protein